MLYYSKSPMLVICVTASLLTACIGESDNISVDIADAAYTGNRTPLYLTMDSLSNSIQPANTFSELVRHQESLLEIIQSPSNNPCPSGGTLSISDNFKIRTLTASRTYNFSNCYQDTSNKIDGLITLTAKDITTNALPETFTIETPNLTLSQGDYKNSFTGTIQVKQGNGVWDVTADLHNLNHNENTEYYLENFRVVNSETETGSISGRIYNSANGYVTISSSPDLRIDDGQGFIYLEGADSSVARISKASESDVYESLLLELDKDGDHAYEEQGSIGL